MKLSTKTQHLIIELLDALRADMKAPKVKRTVVRAPAKPATEPNESEREKARAELRRKGVL